MMAVALQFLMFFVPLRYIQCFLSLGFAGCLFAFSIVEDFKNDLNRFNEMAKSKQPTSQIKRQLNELGIHYRNLKKLSSFIYLLIKLSDSVCFQSITFIENVCDFFQTSRIYCGHIFDHINSALHRYNFGIIHDNADDSSGCKRSKFLSKCGGIWKSPRCWCCCWFNSLRDFMSLEFVHFLQAHEFICTFCNWTWKTCEFVRLWNYKTHICLIWPVWINKFVENILKKLKVENSYTGFWLF